VGQKCGMARNKEGLAQGHNKFQQLKQIWKDVRVPGEANEFNPD